MEIMFIPVKKKYDLKELANLDKMPKKLGLVTTVQYVDDLPRVKEYLDSKGKECIVIGKILGCDAIIAEKYKDKVDAFLYIGSGRFHPIELLHIGTPVFLSNGEQLVIEERKIKGMLAKFYSSNDIGVIISVKQGQCHMDWAEELKKRFPEKTFYFFAASTIDYTQMENFNFVQAWVNTACPRIADDIKVLNYRDIPG
ncbi:2-(3-amino-3-carboxypropyl)histidine synthase subunit [Candidatus Woesearchaeota archaeon]|nr:2-(3-amino-3-carboxypropyl)histidine synthase subunit [Candidatus Woesearchaeota archaeon]